jgi:DNA-binding NtrC family response regulator
VTTLRPRVLVVDDEEAIRINLVAFLEDEGFHVAGAGTGEEALSMLGEDSFDASLVDMRLPGMDGNAFILRAHTLRPSLKFIIYTGSVSYVVPPELKAIGVRRKHVFFKPLNDMTLLSNAIMDLTEERGD